MAFEIIGDKSDMQMAWMTKIQPIDLIFLHLKQILIGNANDIPTLHARMSEREDWINFKSVVILTIWQIGEPVVIFATHTIQISLLLV